MRSSPCKRRVVTAIRWSLLVDALVLVSAALLTISPWPVWKSAMGRAWPVGIMVPEISLWLVPLPVCFAAAALWLGRNSRRWLTEITVRDFKPIGDHWYVWSQTDTPSNERSFYEGEIPGSAKQQGPANGSLPLVH
jgi:hypothetical protein